ncbi:MAG: SMC-Scp complex subunit ScpB, partial [Planctomycetota bacterium]
PSQVSKAVAGLNSRYMECRSSFRIREIAGGYQHYILPEFAGFVEELFSRQRKLRLTRAALETAAIIAYKQPATKAQIEHIRGVASDGVIQNLLEKNMITIVGRAKTVGKPLQYGTTSEFLKFFGLNSLDDLPKMSEIVELINFRESETQTELDLGKSSESREGFSKLNVADGTFDPQRREEMMDGDDRAADTHGQDASVSRLVLKSAASSPVVEEADDSAIPLDPVASTERAESPEKTT